MKLSDYKEQYYTYTGSASSTSRQLALAGIALIWIFNTQGHSGYKLPNELMIPSAWLILSLGSDLLQYIAGSIIWGLFHRHHERRRSSTTEDPDVEAPFYFTWPINLLFYFKIIAVLIAYTYLLKYAFSSILFE